MRNRNLPYRRGPWYRGGVSHSYVPPHAFASVGCAICLTILAISQILGGSIMTGISLSLKIKTKTNFMRIMGPVMLGIGLTALMVAIILCCIAARLARKQEKERHEQEGQPLDAGVPQAPLPASAYPHQQAPQNSYPTAASYPTQSVDLAPPENYPYHQNQFPLQPTTYPPSSHLPPSGSPYTDYPQPVDQAPPENYPCHQNQFPLQTTTYPPSSHLPPSANPYTDYPQPM